MRNDLRQDPRITVTMEIMLESLHVKRRARLRDLSMGGCFVDSIARVNKGETVVFKVMLPGGQSKLLSGEVVNVFPLIGFSLSFTVMTEEEEDLLEQVIRAHSKGTLSYVE